MIFARPKRWRTERERERKRERERARGSEKRSNELPTRPKRCYD
jgi:hypothetical protein